MSSRGAPTGTTEPLWTKTAPMPRRPALGQDTHADVCVVGAGIAGLTTAYLLAKAGKSVVVLDSGPLAGGETARTTAHLSFALDDRYMHLERLHGLQGSRLAAESHQAAVDFIEKHVKAEKLDCHFKRLDGYLFCPPGESTDQLKAEREAAHRAGLADVELVDRAPLPNFDTGPALRFPRQGQFHPLLYLAGITAAIERDGGRIFADSHAVDFEGGDSAHIKTKGGHTVHATAIVLATNTPVNDRVTMHTKQAAYRTYVVGLRVAHGSVPLTLYWDTLDPYHYVRLESVGSEAGKHDVLIVGGEDHKTGQEGDYQVRFSRLEAWARERFPVEAVEYRWSGQVLEPNDGLAFIGHNPGDHDNVYIVTGDSGHGMTHGTIAGMLISDLILGRDNPWEALYNPSRVSLKALKEFAKENINVALEYGQWVTPGEVSSEDEIARGSGAILRRGLSKVAVYRDTAGKLHELSAVCPHLGCIVAWNEVEKSWDCPCHGSRFSKEGKVINGPAISDLPKIPAAKSAG